MQDNREEEILTGKGLKEEEEQELREGQVLYELTKSEGWQVLLHWLEDRAFHTWSDPRETNSLEEWTWREVNTFHAATTAREQLDFINEKVNRAEYLTKVKNGELTRGRMKIN
jgi:hypothetical protein